jgi:hypothetical protein
MARRLRGPKPESLFPERYLISVPYSKIGFVEWIRDNRLCHARFLGLRTDKAVNDVQREV